ncbi:MAG TPA: NAD(P)/FAD-dependent oxidoreductase [Gemmatimonadaceae bacterium]|nr:NAD(P)/FAD-dependent oxidoreductase [Gemmatimonadaceae bacterium]
MPEKPGRPRVVIIGGGFGGIAAAKKLRRANVDITLIDRTNHFIFQPLLYQVATAALAPSDITAPIRWVLRRQRNTEVLMAEAREIDTEKRVVRVDDELRELPYDYLIVAPGSRHHYFGHDEWEPYAPGLKAIEDASEIRRRFLLAYEMAEKIDDQRQRDEYLTFVIVGGGPTGVELSGAIPFIAKKALRSEFRRVDTRRTRVVLVEAGPRILPSFPEDLAAHAARDLLDLGVEIRVNSFVTAVEPDGVCIGENKIRARTAFWAAGNKASPLGKFLGAPLDGAGRVKVSLDMSVPGHPEIFAIGDLATFEQDGRLVPWVCPAANQQGAFAAKSIVRDLRGQPRGKFHYFNKGDLATIGRNRAIADFGKIRFTGRLAWLLWLFVHIMYLVGFRNRIVVFIEWAYAYFTYQAGVRLITDVERYKPPPRPTVAGGAGR